MSKLPRKPPLNKEDLSKTLSWLLRHGAVQEGITVFPGGYVNIKDALKLKQFRKWTSEDILKGVEGNSRFTITTDPLSKELQIKANGFHSFDVPNSSGASNMAPVSLVPVTDSSEFEVVLHGTYLQNWIKIKKEGLGRGNRAYIHLSCVEVSSSGKIKGLIKPPEMLIYVDLSKAVNDGINFYHSDSGRDVIVTPGNQEGYLCPKYFKRVVNVRTGQDVNVSKSKRP